MEDLLSVLRGFCPNLPDSWAESMMRFYQQLVHANRSTNLTRITSLPDFLIKHLADSMYTLAVLPELRDGGCRVADVGTGAGFPGIPLAAALPKCQFVLIDSAAKKTAFLSDTVAALGLENCRIVTGRARELGRMEAHQQAYDYVLARAVADTGVLIKECCKVVTADGRMVFAKTPQSVEIEAALAAREAAKAGLQLSVSPIYDLPQDQGRRQWLVLRRLQSPG